MSNEVDNISIEWSSIQNNSGIADNVSIRSENKAVDVLLVTAVARS